MPNLYAKTYRGESVTISQYLKAVADDLTATLNSAARHGSSDEVPQHRRILELIQVCGEIAEDRHPLYQTHIITLTEDGNAGPL